MKTVNIEIDGKEYETWRQVNNRKDGKITKLEYLAFLGNEDAIKCLEAFKDGKISYENITIEESPKEEAVTDDNIEGIKMIYKGLALISDNRKLMNEIDKITSREYLETLCIAIMLKDAKEICTLTKDFASFARCAINLEKKNKENVQ